MTTVFWFAHESDATIIGLNGFTKRMLLGKETQVSDKSTTAFIRLKGVRKDIKVGTEIADIETITDGKPIWKE